MAASVGATLPAALRSASTPESTRSGIVIHVASPAGPPPLGAPVETSVPFPQGELRSPEKLAVVGPHGKPVLAQMRSGLHWPDGTIRWLVVVFEASAGAGDYVLMPASAPVAPLLVAEESTKIVINSGEVAFTVPRAGDAWPQTICALGVNGEFVPVVTGRAAGDLVLTRHDGVRFRASLAAESGRLHIEERGPLRARIRLDGECRADDAQKLFNYIIRWTVYRGRPELLVDVTWINTTDQPSEQLRDIRLAFPFEFEPNRLVIGCETGVFDGPFLKNFPIQLLQDDHNRYWARKRNPDGRVQNLSSGGCNGERCPGWLYASNNECCLGIWVPNFWEEYPNELALREGELSVGLWPEGATGHLLSKPQLSARPDKQERYKLTNYWPVILGVTWR